jgi:hypothetical protein
VQQEEPCGCKTHKEGDDNCQIKFGSKFHCARHHASIDASTMANLKTLGLAGQI